MHGAASLRTPGRGDGLSSGNHRHCALARVRERRDGFAHWPNSNSGFAMITLSPGWASEVPHYAPKHVIIHAPDKLGMVTLDYDARCFRGGISFRGPVDSTYFFAGRGWRANLETYAVKWLAGVLALPCDESGWPVSSSETPARERP